MLKSKEKVPSDFERALRTWIAASVMSTPIPSPGMQAIRWILRPVEWMWEGMVVDLLGCYEMLRRDRVEMSIIKIHALKES